MPKPSRREFLTGVAAVAVSIPALAQTAQTDLSKYEKNLSHPLSPDAAEKLRASLAGAAATAKARDDYQLPENSEPCTIYRATEAGRK